MLTQLHYADDVNAVKAAIKKLEQEPCKNVTDINVGDIAKRTQLMSELTRHLTDKPQVRNEETQGGEK